MKIRTLAAVAVMGLALASCGNNRDKEIKAIEDGERQLSALDINTQDGELTAMVKLYRDFAAHFPDDSLAPVYLMRAADLSITLQDYDQAQSLLGQVASQYPGYEDMGGCHFLRGYAFEMAGLYDSARAAYTYFVENYPEHSLAGDTRQSIPYIGMSPEEMLEAVLAAAVRQ